MTEQLGRAGSYALVLLLSVLTALWECFLVPLRAGSVPLPVCVVLACVGNVALGTAGARAHGRVGAAVPGLLWFGVVAALQSRRPEGDLVVPGTWTGLSLLLLGTIGAAVPIGLAAPPPR